MIVPVVLAGGVGSRLWPKSRALLPKQFIRFPHMDGTLFQNTLTRLSGLTAIGPALVVCNEDHRFLVAEQLRELSQQSGEKEGKKECQQEWQQEWQKDARILLEPVGRNTAPAVAMAAMVAQENDADAILLVLPADHVIENIDALHRAISEASRLASDGNLVTFGIVTVSPETGYGYIKKGEALDQSAGYRVASFVEKPDFLTAKSYLANGSYLWNSGMFMLKASTFLAELEHYAPDIANCCRNAYAAKNRDQDFTRLPRDLFEVCPSDSIDYAVMEKTEKAAVVPLDAGWNDLGAWSAIWDVADKDASNNVISGDVCLSSVTNSYIQAESRLVAAAGIDDMVIIETSDAVLVAAKDQVQQVKDIVQQLEADGRSESQLHDLVFRPWGSYQSLAMADGYQVKHIVVKPGEALSLQMHHHRAEHWTVVRGEARVTRDDEVLMLKPNESVFLPLGCKHRLENPGTENVEIIEVQVGDYLGEDDIVRFDDVYGRTEQT